MEEEEEEEEEETPIDQQPSIHMPSQQLLMPDSIVAGLQQRISMVAKTSADSAPTSTRSRQIPHTTLDPNELHKMASMQQKSPRVAPRARPASRAKGVNVTVRPKESISLSGMGSVDADTAGM